MVRTTRAARAATADAEAAAAAAAQADAEAQAPAGEDQSASPTHPDQQTSLRDQAEENQHSQPSGSGSRSQSRPGPPQSPEGDHDFAGQGGPSSFTPRDPASHIKIMLATDNHVGYMERDPVRGQDSINTFREILQLAVAHDVDMVLLGGDLFHENKPTRATLHQVMASIREYCMGDKPISLELLSDPNDGQADGYSFPAVNYEDANLNVSIPVFSIHGNHDDPQGVGIDGALSALDLLSVSGLVNYFGKIELPSDDQVAQSSSKRAPNAGGLSDVGIRIRPVLLQKGETKLALYGMGNIKDERMHYELRANRVRMYRPREDPDDWFNILVVHQNRAAHNPKACVPETMFDDSVHLVVWGHEHEQLINPQPVGGKRYYITQPGSSVATSLSPGEASEKSVAIVHIEGRDFSMEPIALQTVRPFIMDDMALKEEAEDAQVSLDDKGALQNLLKNRVYELIDRANEEWDQKHAHLRLRDRPQRMLPLVRLRVEYEANFELGNPIRFGQEFIDKVANPKDVLQFHKKKAPPRKKASGDRRYAYVDVEPEDLMSVEKFEKIKVGGLVKEFLDAQKLELLNSDGLERAITNFVDKDDRDAIQHFVKGMMKTFQGTLNSMAPNEEQLEVELERIREEQSKNDERRAESRRRAQEDEDEAEDRGATSRSADKGKGTKSKGGRTAKQVDSDDSMLMDEASDGFSDGSRVSPVARTGGSARRGGASSRASGSRSTANTGSRGRSNAMFLGQSQADEEEEEEEVEEEDEEDSTPAPRAAASTSKAASRAQALARKTPAKKRAPAAASTSTGRKTATSTAGGRGASRGGRAAAAKASRRITAEADSDDASLSEQDGGGAGSDSPGFEELDEEESQAAAAKSRAAVGRKGAGRR